MEKCYHFAGVEILVALPDSSAAENDGFLGPFRVSEAADPHRFEVVTADTLPSPEGELLAAFPSFRVYRNGEVSVRYIGSVEQSWENAHIHVTHRHKDHQIMLLAKKYPYGIGQRQLLTALSAEHLIARAGGFVFHCSFIERDGKAILFTAPSGTGKSTQAELWKNLRGARIVNGDRAAIRLENGMIQACGIPFAGSSQYCENVTAPLAAIVCLGQAPQTTIRPLRGYPAFRRIWEGCSVNTWDQTDVELATGLVQRVLETVPVFQLDCTPDESAVIALEEMLREQVNP